MVLCMTPAVELMLGRPSIRGSWCIYHRPTGIAILTVYIYDNMDILLLYKLYFEP